MKREENRISIVGTGLELVRLGLRGVEPVLEEMIINAQREIHLLAYVFTRPAIHILEILERKAESGLSIRIVINNLSSQDPIIVKFLKSLAEKYNPYVQVTDFLREGRELHAKVVVVDRSKAIIGSANFSWSGMVNNYEIGVLVEGSGARKMAYIIDRFSSELDKYNQNNR